MTASERGVSVAVVAYGHADQLARCLEPLAGRYALLVIDNSSEPACEAVAQAAGAHYIDPGRNLGFAAAVNRAFEVLADSPTDVLLLNPDAVIEPDELERLHCFLHGPSREAAAAVSPRLRRANQEGEQRVVWPFPTPAGTWLEAIGLGRLRRGTSFLAGSILLLRWEALTAVGRFDERFFLYAEEADWQHRAQLQGWTVQLCDDVVAQHEGAGTSTNELTRETLFHSSAEALLRKWHGPLGWTSARIATIVGALLRLAVRGGNERAAAYRRAKLYLKGPLRAAGAQAGPA